MTVYLVGVDGQGLGFIALSPVAALNLKRLSLRIIADVSGVIPIRKAMKLMVRESCMEA